MQKTDMQKYIKTYWETYECDEFNPPVDEITGHLADDIHHIFPKGSGGSKVMDHPLNLMALDRSNHEEFGDKSKYRMYLIEAHLSFSIKKGVDVEALIKTLPERLKMIGDIYNELFKK